MNIAIRQDQSSDYESIFTLNQMVFGRDDEARLVDALRISSSFIPELSLVALHDDRIVGHILFTKLTIRNHDGITFQSLSLAPMAVSETYQYQGIGTRLVHAGLKKAKGLGYTSVIVLGHVGYYPRFGFKPASQWGIKAPFDVPDQIFMALELEKDGLEEVNGTVEYPEEFKLVE